MQTKSSRELHPERPHPHPKKPAQRPPLPAARHGHSSVVRAARRVAVEGEEVGRPAGEVGDLARLGSALDVAAERLGRLGALEGQEVGAEAGDVGSGHGCAGDAVLFRAR